MRSTCLAKLTVVALWAFHAGPGLADVVTLSDGSRLIGTVERLADGKIVLVTKFAGTLEIDATQITSIETEQKVNVGMTTGDRLVGTLEHSAAVDRPVVQTELGGIPITVDKIEAIWPEGGKSPEVLAMEEQIAKVREEMEAQRARWVATFEAGLFYTTGNKDIFRALGRAEVQRISPKDLLKLYLSGEYSEEDDERSAHEIKGGAYYEHLFTERWFGYGRMDAEYDELENLDLRFSTLLGGGYYWIKRPEHELKTRAGIGYLHESYMDGLTTNAAQAELGLDYRVDIAPWLQLIHSTAWYPTFEALRDYRLTSDTAFLIPFGDSEIWKLKLGALYEYDSIPNPGYEYLDQTYYANILLELK